MTCARHKEAETPGSTASSALAVRGEGLLGKEGRRFYCEAIDRQVLLRCTHSPRDSVRLQTHTICLRVVKFGGRCCPPLNASANVGEHRLVLGILLPGFREFALQQTGFPANCLCSGVSLQRIVFAAECLCSGVSLQRIFFAADCLRARTSSGGAIRVSEDARERGCT